MVAAILTTVNGQAPAIRDEPGWTIGFHREASLGAYGNSFVAAVCHTRAIAWCLSRSSSGA